MEKEFEINIHFTKKIDLSKAKDTGLSLLMEMALLNEEYLVAAEVRDELNKRVECVK